MFDFLPFLSTYAYLSVWLSPLLQHLCYLRVWFSPYSSTYAYLSVPDMAHATQAMMILDQKMFRGHKLTVALADPSLRYTDDDQRAIPNMNPNMNNNSPGNIL